MRGIVLVGGLAAVLAGCSQSSPETTPAAAPDSPTPVAAPTTQAGSGLRGEVSGLSGEITDFRVEQTATATIVEIASDVLFAFDSADLSPSAPAQLARAADLIRQGGPGDVEVRGYTDAKGDDAYNLGLSERRAMEVAGWLRSTGGIDVARLKPRGFGEADPVAPNANPDGSDNPSGRAMNRRVTLVIPRA